MPTFLNAVRSLFGPAAPRKPYRARLSLTSLDGRIVPDAGPGDPPADDLPPGDEAPPDGPADDLPPDGDGEAETNNTIEVTAFLQALRLRLDGIQYEMDISQQIVDQQVPIARAYAEQFYAAEALYKQAQADYDKFLPKLESEQRALVNFDAFIPERQPDPQAALREQIVANIATLQAQVDSAVAIAQQAQATMDSIQGPWDDARDAVQGAEGDILRLRTEYNEVAEQIYRIESGQWNPNDPPMDPPM